MHATNKVQDTVRLHPQTVFEYQRHVVRKSYTKGSRGVLRQVKVDMRVWREAMRLADGDSTRIVVHTPTEVVVMNKSKRK